MVIIDHQAGIRFMLLAFTVKGETVFRVIGVRRMRQNNWIGDVLVARVHAAMCR